MKRFFASTLLLLSACLGAAAQEGRDVYPSFDQLRADYKQVAVVAHVRVKSVTFAATDVHPLYVLQSEVVEPLKGRIRRGQPLSCYLAVDEGFDVNSRLGDWIVFLEGSDNSPTHRWSWFALENSSLPYSKEIITKMRKVRRLSRRRLKSTYGRVAARTGE